MALWRRKPRQNIERRTPRSAPRTTEVFSYYASHERTNTSNDTVRKPLKPVEDGGKVRIRSKWLVQLPSWFALFVIIFSLLYATLLSTNPRIQVGNQSVLVRPTEQYQDAASKILQESLLSKSKITIDTSKVAAKLQAAFPELQTIAVTIPLINQRPIISITVADPVFLLVSRQGGAYFISNQGRALANLDDMPSARQGVLTVVDEGGLALEAGRSALTKTTVDFITTVTTEIINAGYTVETATLAAAPNELQLRLAGKPFYVKMNTTEQGRQQVGMLLALLKTLEDKGATPAEYIDLRVSEKAFYK